MKLTPEGDVGRDASYFILYLLLPQSSEETPKSAFALPCLQLHLTPPRYTRHFFGLIPDEEGETADRNGYI